MINLFTRHSDITSCPWTKQSHLGKCSTWELSTSALVNDKALSSTADFASALSNVNSLKMSDLLEFPVMLLFSSPCSHPKIICKKVVRLWKNSWGRFFFANLKSSPVEVSLHVHLQFCKKHTWMATLLWSYFF